MRSTLARCEHRDTPEHESEHEGGQWFAPERPVPGERLHGDLYERCHHEQQGIRALRSSDASWFQYRDRWSRSWFPRLPLMRESTVAPEASRRAGQALDVGVGLAVLPHELIVLAAHVHARARSSCDMPAAAQLAYPPADLHARSSSVLSLGAAPFTGQTIGNVSRNPYHQRVRTLVPTGRETRVKSIFTWPLPAAFRSARAQSDGRGVASRRTRRTTAHAPPPSAFHILARLSTTFRRPARSVA